MTTVSATQRTPLSTVRAYLGLTKPRVIELLLVTTVPTMVVAAGGLPGLWLVTATLVGGWLAAGSANTLNSWWERDIDRMMGRTAHRPLVRDQVQPVRALVFGTALGAASFVWLAAFVNVLSAALALAAILFYVFVYTLGLKRRTTQNIVIGGAAGCVPVLVGWAAVTGTVGLPAWVLFAIVFAWTPPHFWALALRYAEDYERAGVPMLPVVRGAVETARQILLYTLLLVAISVLFAPVAGLGAIYLSAALLLGAGFLWYAVRLLRHATSRELAMSLFRYSISYLGLLFAAMALDAVL